MNIFRIAGIAIAVFSFSLSLNSSGTEKKGKVDEAEIYFADPTIFVENGEFYMTGTRPGSPQGFTLLKSRDLKHWEYASQDSMILENGKHTFGNKGFWAPQILKKGERYLLAYCANEQLAVAESKTLDGLYGQKEVAPVDESEKNIDPFIFTDDDGKSYLYHVRFNNGNFLWVGEYDVESGKIIPGTLKKCFSNDQPWEKTNALEAPPIMEGPTVVKMDGKYYLFYSANDYRSPDYAVGYATSDSPTGPWIKNPHNPVIHRDIVGENGSGHGDIFCDSKGRIRYVYHVHNSDSIIHPRSTRIISLKKVKDKNKGTRIVADPRTIIVPKVNVTSDGF